MRQKRGTPASSLMLLVLVLTLAAIAGCGTMRPMAASDQDAPKLGDHARFPRPVMVAVANFPPEEIRTPSRTFRAGDRCKIDAGREVRASGFDGSKILVYLDYDTPSGGDSCPSGTVLWLNGEVFAALKAVRHGAKYATEELAALFKKAGLEFE